jgi:hypothetical protein
MAAERQIKPREMTRVIPIAESPLPCGFIPRTKAIRSIASEFQSLKHLRQTTFWRLLETFGGFWNSNLNLEPKTPEHILMAESGHAPVFFAQ